MNDNRLDGQSFDNVRARIEELKRMFPEAVSEGRLNYDTLMVLLGDEFDNENEKYQFTWKGKLNALKLAQKRSFGTLRPDFEESRDWETTGNLYIEGDNLEVLKLLQQGYLRKVKMIYIDPPYNTGNDFVYEDDFSDPIAKYKEVTGQGMRANPETAGRYHSNWLNMMYPRLKIAKTLLRDDGVVFISIDDNEVHNLRKMCDEVFGEENFVAEIVWNKRVSPARDARFFSADHEYIIVYTRNKSELATNNLPRTEKNNSYYKNPDDDPRGPWNSAAYTCNKSRAERPNLYYPITNPNTGEEIYPKESAVWAYSQEAHQQHVEDNLLYWGIDGNAGQPRKKAFLSEVGDVIPRSVWNHSDVGSTQKATLDSNDMFEGRMFPYPKPPSFIERMLQIATEKDDIVLDFFSGSATTAHAVMQINAEDGGNRKFILVQIPEPTSDGSEAYKAGYRSIADIGKERIRRAGNKIAIESDSPPDIGFRVFKLDSSNLQKWDDSYVAPDQMDLFYQRMEQRLDRFKHDRRDIDVVYEVLLKYGVPLTEKLSTLGVQGKKFYVVGEEGCLFVCLDAGLTVEVIEETVRYAPGTMIFADNAFVDDNEIINAGLVLEKAKIEFRWI